MEVKWIAILIQALLHTDWADENNKKRKWKLQNYRVVNHNNISLQL